MLKFDWNFLFELINIILFFVLVRIFLFKPIRKVIDKRKELINNQLADAESTQQQAEQLKAEYQGKLDCVEEEKSQILVDARASAQQEYDNVVARAQAEAERIKNDARKASDLECERAKAAVKEEIAALAMETAEKLIGKNASVETDKEIYDKFLSESSDE